MDRRGFLTRTLGLGCSLAASPLVTPVSFAAAPGEGRLIVIILRGAMDGLAAVSPYGDPAFAGLRGALPLGDKGYVDLDGFYAMHPALRPLMPLWSQGQLGFVHAVSTPYRDKRSHFDGQDLLEAGLPSLDGRGGRDGWLNRALTHIPGATAQTAYAVGSDALPILSGDAPISRWSPDVDLAMTPQAMLLAQRMMQDDPAMLDALNKAFTLADSDGDAVAIQDGGQNMMQMMADDMRAARGAEPLERLAEFVGQQLREDARIASFSINGWDTHDQQERPLARALGRLSATILALRESLKGPAWKHTAVVAMTEFGRTARLNGSRGTDHGTGGAMVLAGGAIRGGRVISDWPGLTEADLYNRRDLMPTRDLRAHAGWLIRGLFGLNNGDIESSIFPDLDMGADPGLLL
ncbi:DUF1501 domain-containing protein [Thalassococcus lentus]|uniref:DUF1501 domain-containing protein n=1 Tax=Thalassococcus lentus TaxID=1210524 RepID=A0ABT4XPC7_9RHOB|nr:DUF1501 domain-containing protein [Thalassococcus lentus]MDA7423803.1 DUF1501 domain-containing protein [Thalassococcus lentus]